MTTTEKRKYTRKPNYLYPHEIERLLERVGLPRSLHALLKAGKLIETVDRMEKQTDALNAALDLWEQANPTAAALAPWYEARERWKADGRPRAQWWELLYGLDNPYIADDLNELYPVRAELAKKAVAKRKASQLR